MSRGHGVDLARPRVAAADRRGRRDDAGARNAQPRADPQPPRRRARARWGSSPATVEMGQSAVSQQLRVLRHLGLVVGERDGRQTSSTRSTTTTSRVLLAEAVVAQPSTCGLGARGAAAGAGTLQRMSATGPRRCSPPPPASASGTRSCPTTGCRSRCSAAPGATRWRRSPGSPVSPASPTCCVSLVLGGGHHRRRTAVPLDDPERAGHDRRLPS